LKVDNNILILVDTYSLDLHIAVDAVVLGTGIAARLPDRPQVARKQVWRAIALRVRSGDGCSGWRSRASGTARR